MRLAFIHMKIA